MADNVGGIDSPAEISAGAAPVDANQRQNRPASANKGRERPKSMGHTLHWFAHIGQETDSELFDYCDYDDDDPGAHLSLQLETTTADNGSADSGSREGGATSAQGRERDDRARLVRERNQGERQRKLEELRAQALAAQRFREQKEDERRRRIDEMRLRDNDRRTQVEERKRAIWEAERERREAILRRNSERDARLEVRRRGGTPAAAVFAFGSSTPRMLEPADTGGTFWGHRRATSTSNVMFAALPLSRRSSERELDPNKKRATSASGLDRQPGDDFRVSSSIYDVFHWNESGPADERASRQVFFYQQPMMGGYEEATTAESNSWSRGVARRRTDLVPTLPAGHRIASAAVGTPRSPVSGLRSGEVTPGSPSRPGSSLSSASVNTSAMTSSVAGALSVNRRPRATPRRPRPASIAGTGVTTPPHVKNNAVGIDGKPIGVRAEKPPLPRVHSAATGAKKTAQPPTPTSDKPEVPRRTHKAGSVKASPRVTPRATPLQSPGNDFPPYNLEEILESTTVQTIKEGGEVTETQTVVSQTQQVVTETSTSESGKEQDITTTLITETVKQVTKDDDGEKKTETTTVTTTVIDDRPQKVSTVTETVTLSGDNTTVSKVVANSEKIIEKNEPKDTNGSSSEPVIVEGMKNMKVKEESVEVVAKEEVKVPDVLQAAVDPLEGADMTGSMMARSRGMITTEEGAKAALAERRKFAREEAERQAERERLRLEREAEEEAERQRQEDERQRRLEEETLRLSELQREAEEERLQQAILEAQRRTEEENQRREAEVRAKAERDIAEARAREEAERQRRDTAQRLRREEEEREARRKRVEAIMLRTRQAKQKKDGDKSPTEENKSLEDVEQKLEAKLNEEESRQSAESSNNVDIESSYELSVRQREEDLFNHTAPHNRAVAAPPQAQPPQSFSPKPAEVETVTGNGLNPFQNGAPVSSSNGDLPKKDDAELSHSNNSYAVQNGHSKNQINELNNFINTSENQFNSVALDNAVKQNNVTNNLLDISDLDILNTANSNNPFLIDVNTNGGSQMQPLMSQQNDGNSTNQIIDLSVETITKNLINEDSVNSNQTNNSPFITSFQDNQENRDVSLL